MSDPPAGHELTLFRLECLAAVGHLENGEEAVTGRDVQELVGQRLEDDIIHGRLYPNLDWLAERDLLEKRKDGKHRNYSLTTRGRALLRTFGRRYLRTGEQAA